LEPLKRRKLIPGITDQCKGTVATILWRKSREPLLSCGIEDAKRNGSAFMRKIAFRVRGANGGRSDWLERTTAKSTTEAGFTG
jgi:hypothetical protein